jgi:hypothetical protein
MRLLAIESQAMDLQRAASSSTPDNSGETSDGVAKVKAALAELGGLSREDSSV